jgi:molybdopterin-containing oxidoreductase family membrane subunit
MAWYSGNIFEQQIFNFRIFGYYAWVYWLVIFCAVVTPLLFFFRPVRTAPAPLFIISILVNIGMWWERFFIVIQSISQNYLPFQWGFYWPNWVELAWTLATFCFLFFAFMFFTKFLPSIPIHEVKKEAGMPMEKGGVYHED